MMKVKLSKEEFHYLVYNLLKNNDSILVELKIVDVI